MSNPRRTLMVLAAAAAVAWWWRPFRAAVVGSSMQPELVEGDYVVAVRRGRIDRGSLVVVERPTRPGFEMIKRVTGLPGDVADGRALGPGEYWVAGDNAEASTDSRSFGPLSGQAIRGVVRWRYWPPGRVRSFR